MAEAVALVGLTGSILQFVDFSSKVIRRLRDFQSSLNEKQNIFSDLLVILPFMRDALDGLCNPDVTNYFSEQTEVVLPMIRGCVAQVELLEGFMRRTIPKEDETSFNKRWKALCSLAREEDVKQAARRLRQFSNFLILHQSIHTSHLGTQVLGRLTALEEIAKTATETLISRLGAEEKTTQDVSESNKGDSIHSLIQPQRQVKRPTTYSDQSGTLCLSNRCGCSCHKLLSKSARFWSWKLTSLANLLSACDRPSCANKIIRTSLYISLSHFNIRQAIHLGLGFAWGESGCSLSFVLRPSRTVKYTSPGFVLLWKCETMQLRWPEAQTMLAKLFNEKEASPEDVDPSGKTWLELLQYPWKFGSREAQFGLFKMLVDSGAKLDTDMSLLCLCAHWIGEGPHLSAVEELLDHGYDVSLVNSQSLLSWPEPSNPCWISEEITPDPFFIELIGKCVKNDPSFGDTTPLMEAALIGSEQELRQHFSKSHDLKINFLGQSVLHLAILRPKVLRWLISIYETVDMPDKNGTTPLMYAAAYDKAESALLLLDQGADPRVTDRLRQRNFLDYALTRDNWSFITVVANHLKQRYEAHYYQEALFRAGFVRINHQDRSGITPLMKVVRLKNAALVEACLGKGASINERDHRGWTALHHIAQELQKSRSTSYDPDSADWYLLLHSELLDTVRLLLRHGADPAARDHCVCACSLSGCTPSTVLLGKGDFRCLFPNGDMWSLEWLQILSELGSEDTGEQTMLDLVRVKQFEKRELTHVCCQRGFYSQLDEDDVHEIIDEENEGIQEVDEMMQCYLECGRGNAQERWIEQLSLMSNPQGIHSLDRVVANGSGLAVKDPIRVNPFSRYNINTVRDRFEEHFGSLYSFPLREQINMKDYCIWLEYYYNNQAKFSTSYSVNHNWYRTRLSWASRLEKALKDASISTHEEVKSDHFV
ncbi:hypothetical protein V496_05056 [Pseudogymnoascus sp. VKM F-4515 (FW-2607)]|nr:hypothetical protein V496_05056 [Pseudogymnoascus sp. VKM F-4515 (FW-2607)]